MQLVCFFDRIFISSSEMFEANFFLSKTNASAYYLEYFSVRLTLYTLFFL